MPKKAKYIVIVESPAKAKTIERYLGEDYKVMASVGHVRDLPEKKFGVDISNDFKPDFEVMKDKQKVIDAIKDQIKGRKVFLASDMDREGEAIAWHLSWLLELDPDESNRIVFSEITEGSIKSAINSPRKIDRSKVDAQLARRILDRIVGYKVSPLVWKVLKNSKTSAGRVQSAALKILVEREREIFKFKPKTFYKIFLDHKEMKIPLTKENGKKIKQESINEEKKNEIVEYLKDKKYLVGEVKTREALRNPPEPFITSTLQQAAISNIGWTSKKTMQVAQALYEGLDTPNGHIAFITYMRTDSKRVSEQAIAASKELLEHEYGKEYVGHYKVKGSKTKVQDAHEAIRPTDVKMTPEAAKKMLKGDHWKLYNLIWSRFVASQSTPAVYDETTYKINDDTNKYEFETVSRTKKFEGFEKFWKSGTTEKEFKLPEKGELKPVELKNESDQTKPPSRFNEAALVKELESLEIGRPSTYATIISTLVDRAYVNKIEKSVLVPTITGFVVTDFLDKSFPEIVDAKFTANMESELDKIESGEEAELHVLKEFYSPFEGYLKAAEKAIKNKEMVTYESNINCEQCGKPMTLMFGRFGTYLSCLPCIEKDKEAKVSKNVPADLFGVTIETKVFIKDSVDLTDATLPENITIPDKKKEEPQETGEKCPTCGSSLVYKAGRFGKFIACSNYPTCKFTKSMPARGRCPKCGSEVGIMRSKKGTLYYRCTNTQCGEMYWDEPSTEKCPDCGEIMFYKKKGKEERLYCPKCKK